MVIVSLSVLKKTLENAFCNYTFFQNNFIKHESHFFSEFENKLGTMPASCSKIIKIKRKKEKISKKKQLNFVVIHKTMKFY